MGRLAAMALVGACMFAEARAQDRIVRLATDDFTPDVRAAVDRGLAFLAHEQQPNGSWINRVGFSFRGEYQGEEMESVDVTALACLALVAGGNGPGRGRYGRNVSRGIDWLLSKSREDGYITHGGSRMYSHALATLFLAEMSGATRQEEIKHAVKRSVWLLANCQNREGGWRHQPIPVDADLSVTVLVLQALRSARNAGIAVPEQTVEAAQRYVERCATQRGFSYMPEREYEYRSRSTYAMTAAGVVAFYSLGRYDTDEVRTALQGMASGRWMRAPGRMHYYYAHYLAAQAAYLAGGESWTTYYPRVREEILGMQLADGHWEDDVGVPYATAMACLVLQMPCETVPLFQK